MMDTPGGGRGDARFNLAYSMNLLSGETPPDIYSTQMGRLPVTSLQQMQSSRQSMITSMSCNAQNTRLAGNGTLKSDCYDDRGISTSQSHLSLDNCGVSDLDHEAYSPIQPKKSPPSNGKKTKGRVKIKMEYIENKLRRYTTFSKRKTGIMKKAYELSTLTGTQVMLLVASETGHVYTFATRKLQPMITSEAGKALIQTCLNSPDPAGGPGSSDQRMSATGFEETELTYNISDDESKDDDMSSDAGDSSDSGSEAESATNPPANDNVDATSAAKDAKTLPNVTIAPCATTNLTSLPPGITIYQTPKGQMYAAPTGTGSNGVPTGTGIILNLQTTPGSGQQQFITIPLMGPAPAATAPTASAVATKTKVGKATQKRELDLRVTKND